jgi:dihydroxyacetone kinase
MRTCSLPGSDEEEGRIRQGHVELGLGIHGEPGASLWLLKNMQHKIALSEEIWG